MLVQGMRQPGTWEREPLERRFRYFDPEMLQFLAVSAHLTLRLHPSFG